MLTNRYVIALGIPLALLACSALARKLVRGTTWERGDFFLGVEFTLASMTSALVYLFDLVALMNSHTPPADLNRRFTASASFLAICFFLLMWILSTHQDWQKRTQDARGQIIWLGVVSNGVGAGLLAAFVLLIKGV